MSKIGYIQRYLLIIRFVRKGGNPTLLEIEEHVNHELDNRSQEVGKSLRTYKRDLADIKVDLGIDIEYSNVDRGYFISEDSCANIEDVLDAFDILNAVSDDNGAPDFIFPEKRRSRGIEHFLPLKEAIKNNHLVQFEYNKFYPEESGIRKIEPYALKESRGRWYLLGVDTADRVEKAFCLDRMNVLSETVEKFRKDSAIDLNKKYEHCFAMFTDAKQPEKVVLSLDSRDGNYVEAMPIHPSQVIKRKGDRVIVELNVEITLDLIMELMSRSWSLEIISPKSLREQMREIYEDALKRNT
jgi:Predicted transcriptional regulator